jgi:murein L,D-transpeptidase YcbB/YkuD
MKILFTFLVFVPFLFIQCSQKKIKVVTTQRDTTITKANAFSELFLDSMRLEQFITEQKTEDSTANLLRNFYNSRNYQFAWFTQDGLAEQARAFWNLHNNYINFSKDSSLIDKRLHKQMEVLINEDSIVNPTSAQLTQTELQLTEHFFEYAQYAYEGKVNPEELQWHIPRKKVNATVLLDSLISREGKDINDWEPVNQQYKLLKKELTRYYQIQKAGAWNEISLGQKSKYKQGDYATAIKQVKQRLQATGDYPADDTSKRFEKAFKSAVQQAQKRFGFKQNGIINAALVNELNVPIEDRIEQLLINMERMRWMPKTPAGNRIVANIPEFTLHVFEDANKVFDMDIVVGKAATGTVVFNDMLKYIVFSPYWNIPRSIVRNEILPGMKRNENYLAARNMEQTGYSNGLPVIRQKPGGANALGKVKFIFPNSYSIYFHDTPSKSLFNREKRAFSHGCIRLAEPKKLAEYLLRNQPEWTSDKISEAMNASQEKWVTLKDPVPVFISYFTAWVDNEGLLNFRDDIYGHDKKMKELLFLNHKNI